MQSIPLRNYIFFKNKTNEDKKEGGSSSPLTLNRPPPKTFPSPLTKEASNTNDKA
jgi:hypothetical protein